MSRIEIPTREEAPVETHPILDNFGQMMGFVPNVVRLLSKSPTVLQAFVGLQGALSKILTARTREAVALAVSQANNCSYCINLHSFVTKNFSKTSSEEVARNLEGTSSDAKIAAAARFGRRLVEARGKVLDEDLAAVKAAGFKEAEIVELIALTAQVSLTNFMNNVAATDIDIPTTP